MQCSSIVHAGPTTTLLKKILKMGLTVLFTHLKIILLQCFQFSVSAKISSIQTDPYIFNFHADPNAPETRTKVHEHTHVFSNMP